MKNIVLIGMSGVGKTQKGRYIAKRFGMNFLDTDSAIVEQEALTIDEIFTRFGENHFRNIEEDIIKRVAMLQDTVISTGGGIILRKSNMDFLKENSFIVYLKGNISTIVGNLNNSTTVRPLLKKSDDLYQSVYELYKFRENLYELYSHMVVDIENKSVEDIYNEVLNGYGEYITCGK